MDALLQTVIFGGGLLACGYILGTARGIMLGVNATLQSLYDAKLADPEKVNKLFLKIKN